MDFKRFERILKGLKRDFLKFERILKLQLQIGRVYTSLMFLFRVIGLKYVVISPYGFEISIFIVLPFLVPPTYKVFFTAYM